MKVLRTAVFFLRVTREKQAKRLLYEKGACKMLMKLTPDVFTNELNKKKEEKY